MHRSGVARASARGQAGRPADLESLVVELYHWTRCSTCRQAREKLAEAGVSTRERDFFAQPLDRAELERLAGMAGGVRRIFSFGSPSFRAMRRAPESFTDAELVALILTEPRLLRRPLATADGRVLVGSREILEGTAADSR